MSSTSAPTRLFTRSRLTLGLVVAAGMALTAGCGGDSDDETTNAGGESAETLTRDEVAEYSDADRTERLIAQAQDEGALMLYTTMDTPEVELFIEKFKEHYPDLADLDVQSWRGGVGDLTQRLSSEYAAGVFSPDIVTYSVNWMEYLGKHEGIFIPFTTPMSEGIDEAAKEGLEFTIPTKAQPYLVAYNKSLVSEDELPDTFDDLISDPAWKDRIAVESTDEDWMGAIFETVGDEKGEEIFAGLKEQGIKAQKGHTQLTQLTGAGQYPLSLTNYIGTINDMATDNPDLGWLALDPTVVGYNGVAFPAEAEHPAAGMLFIDFMLAQEGQELIASAGDVVLREGAGDNTLASVLGDATIAPLGLGTLERIEDTYQPLWEEYILR